MRYKTALLRYVTPGSGAPLLPAIRLGHKAVALKLETLDLAAIHEQSLMSLSQSGRSPLTLRKMRKRARTFFAETVVPIERNHYAAKMAATRIRELTEELRRRTAESTLSTRELEKEIARRESAENALLAHSKIRARQMREARNLRLRLKKIAREILTAQEHHRREMSGRLHDEIAQTLVAINLRLLALNKTSSSGKENLEKEIAATRSLILQSVIMVKKLVHRLGSKLAT